MKFLHFLFAFMLLATVTLKATTRTVSNDPASPAQYHNLQTAVNASSPGDTLLIGPSLQYKYGYNWYTQSYGSITLNFNLVLIGAGAFFDDENNIANKKEVTKVDNIYLKQISATSGAGGSKLFGMDISRIDFDGGFFGSTLTTGGISNVLIERCKIGLIFFSENSIVTNQNDTVRNCIITGYINFNNRSNGSYVYINKNISIENNIFDGAYISGVYTISSGGNYLDSVYVRNNLFLDRTSYAFSKVPHMVIENNIFWHAEPTVDNTPSGATFNNNLCYNTTASLPGTGNSGSGNINNSNPQFINYPAAGGAFSCSHNYGIPSSSPAHNAGTDGSDIGITGGISPFFDYCAGPKVPTIKELTLPSNASSVPQGGTLNVTFKAKNKD